MIKDIKKGILCITLSAACFAFMNLFIRLIGDIPSMQKCFFRNFFALIIAVSALIRSHTKFSIGKGNLKFLFGRSLAGGLGMICNFYAVDHLAISDASMLNKLSPFFAVAFSALIFKEKANKYDWTALIVAFVGALFVIKPSGNMSMLPAVAGALGGLGAGLAYAFVRRLGLRGENSMIIVAFFSGFTTLLLLPNFIINYVPMDARGWLFCILTGIAASGGQIFITRAYSYAPAGKISVYDFSIVIFSAILGFFVLGQLPDVYSIIGYVIIIATAIVKWIKTKDA